MTEGERKKYRAAMDRWRSKFAAATDPDETTEYEYFAAASDWLRAQARFAAEHGGKPEQEARVMLLTATQQMVKLAESLRAITIREMNL